MARQKLLVHPRPKSASGLVHRITPESAGWKYVGFEARDMASGGRATIKSESRETCVVVMRGKIRVRGKTFDSGVIGERESIFEALPWSVYLPPGETYKIEAASDCEIAICFAPAKGGLPRLCCTEIAKRTYSPARNCLRHTGAHGLPEIAHTIERFNGYCDLGFSTGVIA
jgi:5-deoxy-glucuronate isomerase